MGESDALSSFMKHMWRAARLLLTRHLPACYRTIREDTNSRLPLRRLNVGDRTVHLARALARTAKLLKKNSRQHTNFIVIIIKKWFANMLNISTQVWVRTGVGPVNRPSCRSSSRWPFSHILVVSLSNVFLVAFSERYRTIK